MRAFIEPQREVMRRVAMFNQVSIHKGDPLFAPARELTREGYLLMSRPWRQAGRTYVEFAPTERVDLAELRRMT